jgi:SNF2 family DNA or RNA helicase
MPGASLEWETRRFSLPLETLPRFVKQFGRAAFDLSDFQDIEELRPFWTPHIAEGFAPYMPTYTAIHDPIHAGTDRDFQAVGSTFLIDHEACILGDEQGLGKTKQFIDAAVHVGLRAVPQKAYRVLIITRKSVVDVWTDEIARFAPDSEIYDFRSSASISAASIGRDRTIQFYVTTFETMSAYSEMLGGFGFDWVCIDEGHKIKSNPMVKQAAIAINVHDIWAPRRTILTASPMTLGPEDAWNLFHWLEIDTRPWEQFKDETLVVDLEKNSSKRFQVEYIPSGLDTIREMFEKYMLRRLKADVVNLPLKIPRTINYVLKDDEAARYIKAEQDLLYLAHEKYGGDVRKIPNDHVLVLRLRQITSAAKVFVAKAIAETHALSAKLILYSQYRDVIDDLARELKPLNPVVLTGSTTKRREIVSKFQTDKTCRVFIGSTPACREGITLTAATHVVFVEKEWSPKYTEQAIDRAHRIGQTQNVTVWTINTLIEDANGNKRPTIDLGVEQNAKKKQRNIQRVLASA